MNDEISEEEEAVAAAVAAASAQALAGDSGKKGRHGCVIPGCDKQSQGRRNAYM